MPTRLAFLRDCQSAAGGARCGWAKAESGNDDWKFLLGEKVGGRGETSTGAKPLSFLADFMRMTPELLYVLLGSFVVAAFILFKTLPWRSISQDWPPVYGRTLSISFSALCVGYALYGLLTNDTWLPARRRGTIHLHGWCAWSFFLAAACAALFFTSAMGGRIPGYRLQVFRRVMFVSGWFFFILSLMGWVYGKIKG